MLFHRQTQSDEGRYASLSKEWVLFIAGAIACVVALSAPADAHQHPIRQVAAYEDEAVSLLQRYLRIDTSNPPGNEARACDFFRQVFDSAGIENQVFEYEPGRADIYAIVKGDGTERPMILLNHTDVVRADSGKWRTPPFAGEISNGEIVGRGALDMKDIGVLQALVMVALRRSGLRLHRDIIFLGTADEEVNDSGSAWLIKNHPELLRGAEYLITEGGSSLQYPDGRILYEIGVGEKAALWVKMSAFGPAAHASLPVANSAVNRLIRAMYHISEWQPSTEILPFVQRFFHNVASMEAEPNRSRFLDIRRALRDPVFARSLEQNRQYGYMIHDTVAITVLKASEQTNVIPDAASCNLDIRLLPGITPQQVLTELNRVVNDSKITFSVLKYFGPPNSSATDNALFRTFTGVLHEHSPDALITPWLDHGYTESQMYRPLGIAAYGFDPVVVTPEQGATKHGINERVSVARLRDGLAVLL